MSTVQGEFSTSDQARKAIDALHTAGFTGHNVRMWNVIPETAPVQGGSYGMPMGSVASTATVAAAVTGFIFAGLPGLVLGALVGGTVTGTFTAGISMNGTSMPYPTGYRVVVDLANSRADAEAILSQHGAGNVRRLG